MLQPTTLSLTSLLGPARTGGSPMATTSDFALAFADLAGDAAAVALPGAAIAVPPGGAGVVVAAPSETPAASAFAVPPALPDLAAAGKSLPPGAAMLVVDMPVTSATPSPSSKPQSSQPQLPGLVTTTLPTVTPATSEWTASVTTPAPVAAGDAATPIAVTVRATDATPSPAVTIATIPSLPVAAQPSPSVTAAPEVPRPLAIPLHLPSPTVTPVVAPLAVVSPDQAVKRDDPSVIAAAPEVALPIAGDAPPKVDGRRTRYELDAPTTAAAPARTEVEDGVTVADTSDDPIDADTPTQKRAAPDPATPDPYLLSPVAAPQPASTVATGSASEVAAGEATPVVAAPVTASRTVMDASQPAAAPIPPQSVVTSRDAVVPAVTVASTGSAPVTMSAPTDPFVDRAPANLDTVRAIVRPAAIAPDTAVPIEGTPPRPAEPVDGAQIPPTADSAVPQPPLTTVAMPAAQSLRAVQPPVVSQGQAGQEADIVTRDPTRSPDHATRPVLTPTMPKAPRVPPSLVTRGNVTPATLAPVEAAVASSLAMARGPFVAPRQTPPALATAPIRMPDVLPTSTRPIPSGEPNISGGAAAPVAAPTVPSSTPAAPPPVPVTVSTPIALTPVGTTPIVLPVDIAVEAARPVARPDVTTVALPAAAPPPPQKADVLPAAQMFAQAMFAAPLSSADAEEASGDSLPLSFVSGFGSVGVQAATIAVPGASAADGKTLDMSRAEWMTSMIDTIETLRDESGAIGETRLKLSPDALGNLDVTVRRDDAGQYQVRIATDTAQARTILTDAAPRLHDMAEARGLKLSHAGVDTGAGANPGFTDSNRRDAQQTAPTPRRPASAANDAGAAFDANQPDTRLA